METGHHLSRKHLAHARKIAFGIILGYAALASCCCVEPGAPLTVSVVIPASRDGISLLDVIAKVNQLPGFNISPPADLADVIMLYLSHDIIVHAADPLSDLRPLLITYRIDLLLDGVCGQTRRYSVERLAWDGRYVRQLRYCYVAESRLGEQAPNSIVATTIIMRNIDCYAAGRIVARFSKRIAMNVTEDCAENSITIVGYGGELFDLVTELREADNALAPGHSGREDR